MSSDGRPAPDSASPLARTVLSFDDTPVRYDLHTTDQKRVVLVVPGFWRSRRWPSLDALVAMVSARASAAVMDLRGHGDSGGTFGFNLHEWRDVAAVARDLVEKDRFPRVDLLGFSLGASIAVTAAARAPEIPWGTILLISPVSDFALIRPRLNPLTIRRHIAFSQAFRRPRFDWGFPFREKIRASEEIGKVNVPVTIVHVRRDWLVHHKHSESLYARAREPKRLELLDIPGRWHADRVLTSAPEAIEPVLREFLEK